MLEYITYIFHGYLPLIVSAGLTLANSILIIAVAVAVTLAAAFLIINHKKKTWKIEKHDLVQQIKVQTEQKEALEGEIAGFQGKLKLLEEELSDCSENRELLSQRIEELEEEVKQLSKKEDTGKKDVMIEYYMNDKA